MKINKIENIFAFLATGFLILELNPFGFIMPDSFQRMVLISSLIIASIFLIATWTGNPLDERDLLHNYLASRISVIVTGFSIILSLILNNIFNVNYKFNIEYLILLILIVSRAITINFLRHKK